MPPPRPTPPPAPEDTDRLEARAERRLRLLDALADVAMEKIKDLRDAATTPETVAAYVALAKSLRQTLALQDRFEHPVRQRAEQAQAKRQATAAEAQAGDGLKHLADAVERHYVDGVAREIIETEADNDEQAERLLAGVRERLDCDERYEDLDGRATGEVLASLFADLGLTLDWSYWADEDWAIEEAETEAEGSPFCPPREKRSREDGGGFRKLEPPENAHLETG